MNFILVFLIFVAAVSAGTLPQKKTPILLLDDNNFHSVLKPGSGKYFIRFYTSLCEICKAFTPEFVKVGEAITDVEKGIQVADFDCHFNKKICDDLWIDVYPYYMVIADGEIEYERDEEMTVDECLEEANKQFDPKKRSKRDVEDKFNGNIAEITNENFISTIASGTTIVIFGMAWCPHCQHDLELMTEVKEKSANENVEFVLVNCAKVINLDLCFDQLVNGVPTINTFLNGIRMVKDYQGTTVKKFNEMIKAHSGGVNAVKQWKAAEKAVRIKESEQTDDSVQEN